MKKIFLIALFAVMSLTVNAQNKNDGTYEHFIIVYTQHATIGAKKPCIPMVAVEDEKLDYLYDSKGEQIKFYNTGAMINYFTKKGWAFVQREGDYYYFKKIVKDVTEAKEGIILKNDIKK